MDHLDNDLLTEIKLQDNVVASQGKRFANYIIDLILFYILAVGFGVVLAIASPETLANLDDDSLNTSLIDRIVTLFVYGTIMGLIEGFTKGKTLGKLITGTKAVNLDGSKITF